MLSFPRVAGLSWSQGWEAGPGQPGKVVGDTQQALSVTIPFWNVPWAVAVLLADTSLSRAASESCWILSLHITLL